MECMKSELDLFSLPAIQSSVLSTREVIYNPITGLDSSSSTLDFLIPGNGDKYLNLNRLYLRLLVEMETKKTTAGTAKPDSMHAPINNILHSLFRQVTVFLNGVQISQDNDYPYKSFLLTLLNYGSDASRSHLETSGWILDEKNMSSLLSSENSALGKRQNLFANQKRVELFGKIHVDFFNQPKYLLNNVDVKISFAKEKPSFYIMEDPKMGSSNIKILDANIFVDQLTINPNLLIAHHRILEKTTSKYPIKKVVVRQFTINSKTHSLNIDNVVIGQLPNVIVFGMVKNESYTGAFDKNPFHFESFDLNQFVLFLDGQQIPSKPLKFNHDAEKGKNTSLGYRTLFKGSGIHHYDRGLQVTKEMYDNCYFLLVHDLTADHAHDSDCMNGIKQGNLRIEGTFTTAIPDATTCILLFEFDQLIEIDSNRNVKITF